MFSLFSVTLIDKNDTIRNAINLYSDCNYKIYFKIVCLLSKKFSKSNGNGLLDSRFEDISRQVHGDKTILGTTNTKRLAWYGYVEWMAHKISPKNCWTGFHLADINKIDLGDYEK